MKKKLFFAAIALTTLAGCTDESYVGDQSLLTNDGGAISFNMKTPAITRSDASTAGKLGNEFVVFGYKTTTTPTYQVVFDNYVVKWVDNTASTTESNSANWEYVSYTSKATTPVEQSIKYWDFNASSYDFFAYSLGKGDEANHTHATASVMTNSTYTLSGTGTQLGACYISKKYHIEPPSSSTTQVTLQFVSFLSKIQLGFFEAIPGYSVKDVKFYVDADNKSTGDDTKDGLMPVLYGASGCIPRSGTYTITFDGAKPVVTLTGAATATESNVQFPAVTPGATSSDPSIWLSGYANKEYKEAAEDIYLGRTSSTATLTNTLSVLPNTTGATLTLKIDYTLVSRDGTEENIQVTGKTATIPADFTKWMSNYAYTYIFKITDDQLVPITLDAVIVDDEDGNQTTITTVTTPSITTYQKGAIANEYNAGNIYVVVGDGSIVLDATSAGNASLYTATIEKGAAQGIVKDGETEKVAITENMIENALTNGETVSTSKVVTDANGKKLTVTPVASDAADKLTGGLTTIPAADAPGGKELAVNCASFAAANNTVYVFEYHKAAVTYDTDGAKIHNAGLPGALTTSTTLTAEQAAALNTVLGAETYSVGGHPSEADANTYNATLSGAVSDGDEKEAAVKVYKVIKVGNPTPIVP